MTMNATMITHAFSTPSTINFNFYGDEISTVEGRQLFGDAEGDRRECFHPTLQMGGSFQAIRDSEYGEFHGNNGVRITVPKAELEFTHG